MPRAVDVQERRASLTDAAARLIAQTGIEAATLRNVAAEAGLTTGALTHYFADKRELMLHTFEASLSRRHRRRATVDLDANARLRASLEAALPLDDERHRHWMVTVAFCAQAAGDDELAAVQRDAYREFRTRITDIVRDATGLAQADAGTLAELLIAAADGIAVQALFDPERWTPSAQRTALDAAIDLLLAR